MANRLAGETSPYLLQHADNPVDWQPWDAAALADAKERNVPILVSIGYSACHWCHVMEHESFSDDQIAKLMNDNFVCIKVDREERPDVDSMFMDACQRMNGHGGWPLNAFATPDGKPFWAGTYFPPLERGGMPSWPGVLEAIAETWREREDEVLAAGERIAPQLAEVANLTPQSTPLDSELTNAAVTKLAEGHDGTNGGFGRSPKFPPHEVILFLLASGERDMSLHTLRKMAEGGIHDQIGGGFCRYAVDSTWTVPHFEKMLSDNALLAVEYLRGWQVSGEEYLLEVCRSTLDWMLRELADGEGAFFSSLDADDPEGEGRFYAWSPELVEAALGDGNAARIACEAFAVTDSGNFEDGLSVAVRACVPDGLDALRERLLGARESRPRPATDTKVITAWNALAISAFAQAGATLGEPQYLQVATSCADYLLEYLRGADGRLLRCRTAGRAAIPAVLEDHALLLAALIDLYEATFDEHYYVEAVALAEQTLQRFGDPVNGGFFITAIDGDQLAVLRKDLDDHPIPSGNGAMALALLRLHGLSGDHRHAEWADSVIALTGRFAQRSPMAFGRLLQAIKIQTNGLHEVAIVGEDSEELISAYRSSLRPNCVIASRANSTDSKVPLLEGRGSVAGEAAAYVCRNFSCQMPTTDPESLSALIEQ